MKIGIKKRYCIFCVLMLVSFSFILSGCSKGKYGEDTKNKSMEMSKTFVEMLSTKEYDKIISEIKFTSDFKKEVSADYLKSFWEKTTGFYGALTKIEGSTAENWDSDMVVHVQCVFEKGQADIILNFDRTVSIDGIALGDYTGI